MRVSEAQSLLRKLINIRRLDFFRAVATEVAVADVVGENENDVGRLSRLRAQLIWND